MDDKNFGYQAKLDEANYHAVNLLVLLKKLDSVCMPAEITIDDVEHLYTNLTDLVDYINKKRYWRLNNE